MIKKDKKYRTILGARLLRHKMTRAEAILWGYLRDRNLVAVKFRRQHPINGFILDFYCPECRLGIEVDGGIHNDRVKYDHDRQMQIESLGIKIIRFKNHQIIGSLDQVLKSIKEAISPSPQSGEGWSD